MVNTLSEQPFENSGNGLFDDVVLKVVDRELSFQEFKERW